MTTRFVDKLQRGMAAVFVHPGVPPVGEYQNDWVKCQSSFGESVLIAFGRFLIQNLHKDLTFYESIETIRKPMAADAKLFLEVLESTSP